MKGHVLIANNLAQRIVGERGVFAVFAEDRENPQWRKTRADILSDLACLRAGDRVFFYNLNDKGFWGVFEATTRVLYCEKGLGLPKPAPYWFGVRPFLPLEKPIAESNLFSRKDAARDFRSIFFKKVLNRGKACTHLFPDEVTALTEALLMQNDRIPSDAPASAGARPPAGAKPLLPDFRADGSAVSLEKELEWWLTHNLDGHEECRKIVGNPSDIEMFANYVPITISGGNIDLVVYHHREAAGLRVRYKISVIELKKDRAKPDALRELSGYVRWFVRNIVGPETADIIQPVLIANSFHGDVPVGCRHWNLSERKPLLFKYSVSGPGALRFEEVSHDG